MDVSVDAGCSQKIGSHIQLKGRAFRIPLFLDEVITLYEPLYRKEWKTVGIPKLLVIGHYRMGVEINAEKKGAWLKVSIDYELPESWRTRWLGYLFSRMYAKWCVRQMLQDVGTHFEK